MQRTCFISPSTCNYCNQDAAQFTKGIIINYEEKEKISLNTMEHSYMVAQVDSGGNHGTNQITVFAIQCIDSVTEKQMVFDECIAVQRKSLLQPSNEY